ncbi:N-6 DNA methylase [Hymenobacter rigui]|uniref:SAM-dependent methyltransferase n=1 Tax=Hymenobacter rigui TaxID=334424 RepID=A0A428KS87_9BACT|nr:N-6 DNA methylase [Hymenobacter rigui]RSK49396.1 SAM-dependent methyltransferase [Hymenobacter rigui]
MTEQRIFTLRDILNNTEFRIDLFSPEEIGALELFDRKGKPYLRDHVSGKDRPAKPEEIVRQLFLRQLNGRYGYPKNRIQVETAVQMGRDLRKAADILITDPDDLKAAYLIVEVKRPKEKDGMEQLKSYANATGAPLVAWTNGQKLVIMHREEVEKGRHTFISVPRLPMANETLADVIAEQVTISELKKRNKLVTERLTLKEIILDLEDLVLSNAGVDAFEEIFKLIYAKLYDEWKATNLRKSKEVHFRLGGSTETQLYDKINGLFEEARDKWPGVFLEGERIDLNPAQLKTCVSFLQDIVLFNSNLQVIDEAFEYLTVNVAKGSKGQYFTPRHVIDMAVKMINPKRNEYVIDTAAGSCGFTVHSIFHVWGGEFTAAGPTPTQAAYAAEMVYALDFDARSVKVARALNLIAGDGKTQVFRANTLDTKQWSDELRVGLRPRLRKAGNLADKKLNEQEMRYFDFDVLLANPPFAGDVSDTRVLRQYALAKKYHGQDPEKLADDPVQLALFQTDPDRHRFRDSGKWQDRQARDILFVERNLDFLRPGGRTAIVLPQGRFNNITDGPLRWWVAQHARVLGVVGLGVDTFKPHTGTKTSVWFLQKWNDDPKAGPLCPFQANYPVFFATSEVPGKDGRGEYVYVPDPDLNGPLLDLEGHPIVDHDLFDQRQMVLDQWKRQQLRYADDDELLAAKAKALTRILEHLPQRETIAEKFIDFAQAEGLTFWQEEE